MQLNILQQSFRVVIDVPKRDFYAAVSVRALTHKARSLEEAQVSLGLNNLVPYLEMQIHQANLGRRMNKNPKPGSNQLSAGEWVPVPQKRDAYGWRSNLNLPSPNYFDAKCLEATINRLVKDLLEQTCALTSGKIELRERRSDDRMTFGVETKPAFP